MKLISILIVTVFLFLGGCSGCSKSGRKKIVSEQAEGIESRGDRRSSTSKRTVVKMEKLNGVFQIPIEVNGVNMFFIFDTGAGMVSISNTEAMFLYKQGTLTEEDILGTANFIDANGDISEGTIINLKSVKVGNRTLTNINASVVHNMEAPLLLGQSVLERFGKISIDNNRGEITFE